MPAGRANPVEQGLPIDCLAHGAGCHDHDLGGSERLRLAAERGHGRHGALDGGVAKQAAGRGALAEPGDELILGESPPTPGSAGFHHQEPDGVGAQIDGCKTAH
jgi:hypothetical protein